MMQSTLNCQCGTRWEVKLKAVPSKKNGYDTSTRCVEMSQELADIMKNRQAAKSVDQDAQKVN